MVNEGISLDASMVSERERVDKAIFKVNNENNIISDIPNMDHDRGKEDHDDVDNVTNEILA
ncbi:hypothetical protein Tco_1381777, partial [Tanacetum coccineum]